MANPIIYNGNPGPISGSTPFGYFDNDSVYQADGPKVANYCARKLGYPVLDVELQDLNIYACFEEATAIYAEELYQIKIKDNYITLEGTPTGSTLNNTVVSPNLTNVLNISETYGQAAGVGGFVNWRTGSIDLLPNTQNYDLYAWAVASQSMNPSDRIIVQRVMYQAPPAIYGWGYGAYYPQLGGAGANPGDWGGYGMGAGVGGQSNSVTLYPVFWDIERIQELEMSNQVRLPAWSFEIIGTNLRIMPIPKGDGYLAIQYCFQSDLTNLTTNSPYDGNQGLVSNPSQAPYADIVYAQINQPGKQWIKEYTAALTSELLGLVRGKYQQVAIPGSEVTLNYADLISRGQAMQTTLREKLRGDLEEMSRKAQLERKQSENQSLNDTLNSVPMMVYIG